MVTIVKAAAQDVPFLGVPASMTSVEYSPVTGVIYSQKLFLSKMYRREGERRRLDISVRFDDRYGNKHETFYVTAMVFHENYYGVWREEGSASVEEMDFALPGLSALFAWNGFNSDGPSAYIANTTYLAGERDYDGLLAGELDPRPCHRKYAVRFDSVPMRHEVSLAAYEFIQSMVAKGGHFTPLAVEHKNTDPRDTYKYSDKYTFEGLPVEWHNCLFDDIDSAERFCKALNNCKVYFDVFSTKRGKGKARELDSARRAAFWPEATDEELSQPIDLLTEALEARLPALIAQFNAMIKSIGFILPAEARLAHEAIEARNADKT